MTPTDASDESPAPELASLARHILSDRQDSDDVAQDVWLLLKRQPDGRVRSLRAWLAIAIRHVAVRQRQRERRRSERERIVARRDHAPSVLDQLEQDSQRELLTALVHGLPEPYRAVVRLRYLEEREIEEIVTVLGRSPGTVRSQLKRGLDQMRARMGVEPRRRRELSLLFPWLRRRGDPPPRAATWSLRAALVAGGICAAVVVAVFAFGPHLRRGSTAPNALVERSDVARVDEASVPIGRSPVETVRAPAEPPVPPAAGPDPWHLELAGDVLDASGAPVPGASVRVGDAAGGAGVIAAHADASGRYRIAAADRRQLVWAEDDEGSSSRRHLIGSKASDANLDLRLGQPLGALVGRVLSPLDVPVADAEVVLFAGREESGGSPVKNFALTDQGTLALGAPPTRARTSADGSFRLALPPQDELTLYVEAAGYAPLVKSIARGAKPDDVELRLPEPCRLEGELAWPDGVPAAGLRLGLVFPEPLRARETTTDEDGRFHFDALPSGPFAVRLLESVDGGTISCFVEGELAAGSDERLPRIMLGEDTTVRGRALDGDAPLADWIVELEERQLVALPHDLRRTRTAADGTFAFPSCAPAGEHLLRLYAPDDESGMLRAIEDRTRPGQREVVLRADEELTLDGRLVGSIRASTPELRPVLAVLRSAVYPQPILFALDPDGGFEVLRLPTPGTYKLEAWIPGVGVWVVGPVEVLPGKTSEVFARVPEPGVLRLVVEPTQGAVVEWERLFVQVAVPSFHEANAQARSQKFGVDRENSSLSTTLFPGEYDYQVRYQGAHFESRRVTVESGATTTVTVRLPDVVSVRVRFELPRRLHRGEKIVLHVREGGVEREIHLGTAARRSKTETFRISLARCATELDVETKTGKRVHLRGQLFVTPADLVADRELRVELEAIDEQR